MSKYPVGIPGPEQTTLEQTTPQLSPIQSAFAMQPPHRSTSHDGILSQTVLPPLRTLSHTPPTPSSDRRQGNHLQSILNPQAELAEQQRNRRRSASQMDSPSPIDTHASQGNTSISRPPSVDSTQDDYPPPRLVQPLGKPPARPVRSPKSPRVHRTQSLNLLNPPTGTIDAQQSPFLTASTRPSEPLLSHQSLPTPPPGSRPSYFPTMSATGSAPLSQSTVRTEVRRPSVGFAQSGSASPVAQYSPYSQPASVASSQFENSNTPGHYVMRHPGVQLHDSRLSTGPMETERNNMIPMGASVQSSIQFMTIKSQQGHNVQIPVDVQAASKVADEKRRRNAGASARFRARRKEKEREASMSISRLEQQLRDALEDTEYYRSERDFFKGALLQQTRAEGHYARPPSPRLRRPSVAPSQTPSSARGASEDSFADYEEEIREEERNVRRRTSNYHPVSGSPPTDIGAGSLGPQGFPTTFSSITPVSAPGMQQSHPSSQQHMAPERPVYRNPFAADAGRYENRGWAATHGQPRES